MSLPLPIPHPPLPTPASLKHLRCLFLKDARPYLRPSNPFIWFHECSAGRRLTQKPSRAPAPAPAGGNTQQQPTTSHWSPVAAATAGPPSNPATPCLADYFCSLFRQHNGSERNGCLGHRLFIPGAIGCCKTRFLPQEEVGGFSWKWENRGREALGTATLKHK